VLGGLAVPATLCARKREEMGRQFGSQSENIMKILVTGGAGYIGSHAIRVLAQRRHDITVCDNLSTGHKHFVEGFKLIEGDIGDVRQLHRALEGVELVMHFAGSAYVGESVSNPRKYFQNNAQNAVTLLNTAMDAGVQQFVFSSSCAVYGVPSRVPIAEDAPCSPVNPYGDSKLFFERVLEAYGRAYGLRSVSLRYFNAGGADGTGEIGEFHNPETHLIPLALEAAAGLRPGLDIFGNDYATPDGTCIRDYIHVNDLAQGHADAVNHLQKGGEPSVFNLGTGTGYSVKQVVTAVEQVTGCAVKQRLMPRRPGDPAVLVADPTRAHRVLGWRTVRRLEDAIASAWKWMHSGTYRDLKAASMKSTVNEAAMNSL